MRGVGRTTGRHSGEPAERPAPPTYPGAPGGPRIARGRLVRLAAGATLTLVAWGLLVVLAIDFGGRAREGNGAAWGYLLVATVGATACLFLALILIARAVSALRGDDPAPPRTRGGKRAAR